MHGSAIYTYLILDVRIKILIGQQDNGFVGYNIRNNDCLKKFLSAVSCMSDKEAGTY